MSKYLLQEPKAIELYLNGLSIREVSKLTDIPTTTLKRILDKTNVTRRSAVVSHPQKIVDLAIELYKDGMNSKEISEKLNVNSTSIIQWVRKNNVEVNHKGPQSKIKNEDFFDIIDSEEKAYYLGWIMADGNVSVFNNQYSLKLHIAYKDKELIDSFLEAIKSTNKTKIKESISPKSSNLCTSYYVSLSSIHMVNSLMKHGIVPQKSGKEIIPSTIPKSLMCHFIRGYFDGDGITDISLKRSGFIAPVNVLRFINTIIELPEDYLIRETSYSNGICYILYYKKNSLKLYNYIYQDATIFLKRKKDRMNIICGNTEVTC